MLPSTLISRIYLQPLIASSGVLVEVSVKRQQVEGAVDMEQCTSFV